MIFRAGKQNFDLAQRVLLMGILNVTPDSFSEQGENFGFDVAVSAVKRMIGDGADIIDVGGESTRPGAAEVSAEEEIARVVPVIEAVAAGHPDCCLSVDTSKAVVARAALAAGAVMINDVSGFHRDPEMIRVAADSDAGCVVMHMRGTPQTMTRLTDYDNLLQELGDYFQERVGALVEAGIVVERICIDPGIGFSKTAGQSLELINRLDECIETVGRPLLLGPSRKSFIGKTLGIDDPQERVWGTAAAVSCGILRGARLIRVHDVAPMREVCDLALAIANTGSEGGV